MPSCIRAPPPDPLTITSGSLFFGGAFDEACVSRSPTTEPIDPMMNAESVAANATRRARIMPVPVTAASFNPVRACSAARRSALRLAIGKLERIGGREVGIPFLERAGVEHPARSAASHSRRDGNRIRDNSSCCPLPACDRSSPRSRRRPSKVPRGRPASGERNENANRLDQSGWSPSGYLAWPRQGSTSGVEGLGTPRGGGIALILHRAGSNRNGLPRGRLGSCPISLAIRRGGGHCRRRSPAAGGPRCR